MVDPEKRFFLMIVVVLGGYDTAGLHLAVDSVAQRENLCFVCIIRPRMKSSGTIHIGTSWSSAVE